MVNRMRYQLLFVIFEPPVCLEHPNPFQMFETNTHILRFWDGGEIITHLKPELVQFGLSGKADTIVTAEIIKWGLGKWRWWGWLWKKVSWVWRTCMFKRWRSKEIGLGVQVIRRTTIRRWWEWIRRVRKQCWCQSSRSRSGWGSIGWGYFHSQFGFAKFFCSMLSGEKIWPNQNVGYCCCPLTLKEYC